MWLTDMSLPTSVNTCQFDGHTELLFSISCTDRVWKGEKSGLFCLWNREESNNEPCIKVERLQGCLCFYRESSCVLINLPPLQREYEHTQRITVCVLFNMLQRQLQDGVYSWPPLLRRCYVLSVRIGNRQRERKHSSPLDDHKEGGIYEYGGREIIFHLAFVRAESVRGRKSQAGFSFVVSRWQLEQLA